MDSKQQEIFGHPKGLFYLFFAELWERFSFYGMRALLLLYMTEEIYKNFDNRDIIGTAIFAAYGALVYATPVLGGMLADKLLGLRRSILLGGILMALGHFILVIQNEVFFFGALALIIVGNGYFKPNISSFVGALYKQGDPRRDSGFTIFYMGINLGAFSAPLICGWLGYSYGWHYGFGVAGIGMLSGVIVFWRALKKGIFGNHGHAPDEAYLSTKKMGLVIKNLIPLLSFLIVPVIGAMMYYGELTIPFYGVINYEGQVVDYIFYIILVVILFVIVKTMMEVSKEEREKLLVIVFLTIFMSIFWGFYEMSGATFTLFAARNIDLVFLNASQTNAITALYIIALAFPFTLLWAFLGKMKSNPYTPYKFAIGLLIIGVGFAIYAWSGSFANAEGKVPMMFMMFGYLMFSTGELFLSPVGLSKVTELAPKQVVSFMMGVWFLASAFAFRLVGMVGKWLAIEGSSDDLDPLVSLEIYTNGFEQIALIAISSAALAFVLAPLLKKWMHNIH